MSKIKNFFMLSALIIGVGGALAWKPDPLPPCTKFRYCDSPLYSPIGTQTPDCDGQDLINKDCMVAEDGGECDEAQPNSCVPLPEAK